ncbi:MAG: hypothetical protein LC623_09690 [Halobacteriales archaeon]|nr:hypothetical protein [Halobacteriales archaeon]
MLCRIRLKRGLGPATLKAFAYAVTTDGSVTKPLFRITGQRQEKDALHVAFTGEWLKETLGWERRSMEWRVDMDDAMRLKDRKGRVLVVLVFGGDTMEQTAKSHVVSAESASKAIRWFRHPIYWWRVRWLLWRNHREDEDD